MGETRGRKGRAIKKERNRERDGKEERKKRKARGDENGMRSRGGNSERRGERN